MAEDREKLLEQVKQWPKEPGIYQMKDAHGRILYVGKAKNLRNRAKSYFQKSGSLAPKTRALVTKVSQIEFTVTQNELEAILLECSLIKKHRPRYNVRLKDDKNFPYFVLDYRHEFPQFKMTRKVKTGPKVKYFGPYSAGVKELSRFLLKAFRLRDCTDSKFKNRTRPCLNYEIGICTAPCVDYVSKQQYQEQVDEAVLFLTGKSDELEKRIVSEMEIASNAMKFEEAKIHRDKLFSLQKIVERQDAVKADRKKNVDVVGYYAMESEIRWLVLYVRSGFLTGRHSYRMKMGVNDFKDSVATFLSQIYATNVIPDEIWIGEKFSDFTTVAEVLSRQADRKVKVVVARSEEQKRLLSMANENAKLIQKESERNQAQSNGVSELQAALKMAEPPIAIEGIDISNLLSDSPVGSLVHFEDGTPLKSRYRLYHPKTVDGQNDFAMIHEVVHRRFSDKENPPPDLLMIDGGKGQLSAAVRAFEELGIGIPLCSLAKSKTSSAFSRKEIEKTEERIFLPGRKNPIVLGEGHPALRLLQRVRDEAHRFGVKNHRKRRDNATLSSVLEDVAGIGEKTRKKLMMEFGSIEKIATATLEALASAGVNRKAAEALLESLQDHERTSEEQAHDEAVPEK